MLRRPIIAANWKMHKTTGEARALAAQVAGEIQDDRVEVVLCPPFTSLAAVGETIADSSIRLGAQNVYWQAEGAYTGEISPAMLVDLGCRYAIIGHSERRQLFGETDESVARKAKACVAAGVTPVICVGEGWPERERGETEAKVAFQVRAALAWLTPEEVAGVVFAYEPLWAIGTGRNADGEAAGSVCRLIRQEIASLYGEQVAAQVRAMYGGSVKPENVAEFAREEHIDGALVGGASLVASGFVRIVQSWVSEERAAQ